MASDGNGEVRILHVEDDAEFAALTADFLRRENERFAIETASDSEEGFDRLEDANFDCVVSDYDMPGRNGVGFLKAVRKQWPDLPFILYTGKGSEEVASEAVSAGVTDYLQKETGTEQYRLLANRIDNAVEHSRSIHELSRRNETLRRYQHMVNSLGEAACIYDGDGRFAFANKYTADWYDTTPEELEGTQSPVIAAVRDAADGDPIQELLAGERSEYSGEIEAEFPDHGRAVVEYEFAPLYADGEIEGIVGTLRDRTAQKDRKRTLKRFEAATENAGHAIYFTDREGTIVYVNPAFERITGYDAEEVIGENPRILKSGEMDDEYYDELWETLLSGERWEENVVNRRSDGERYTAHQTIAPITEDGDEITGFVAIQSDITENLGR